MLWPLRKETEFLRFLSGGGEASAIYSTAGWRVMIGFIMMGISAVLAASTLCSAGGDSTKPV